MAYDTLSTAKDITDLLSIKTYQDSVSPSDPYNYYRFQLSSRSEINLSLTGLTADASIDLIQDSNRNGTVDNGEVLASSTNPGSLAELINTTLDKGSYYIRVSSSNNGVTPYQLNLPALSGNSDLLWHHYGTGQNLIWQMNGSSLASLSTLQTVTDTNWKIDATGDFNNDGQTDLLWRNYKTGQNLIWQMNGSSLTALVTLQTVTDTNWKIDGTGDFNNDGQTDLVWRNYGTGQNLVWYMNGSSLASLATLLTVTDTNWKIDGTGDFNSDGKTDLVWRNYGTGQNLIWQMNGSDLVSRVSLQTVTDANWKIDGTGDFNNDGQTDLVWRNYGTGQNLVWQMNGSNLAALVTLQTVTDTNWKIDGIVKRRTDGVGNDRTTALDIGTLSGSGTFKDSVGGFDPNDYYKFKLDAGSTVNLSLSGLSADANMRLLTSDGTVVQSSINSGTTAESI
jgi:Bacterial pre-peptidase C-terminal domain/FG-GAP-like repeat